MKFLVLFRYSCYNFKTGAAGRKENLLPVAERHGMYSYQSRIRYSELDETGHLRLESLLDYFQDCSTFHSEDVGLGVEYLAEHHMVWVLSSWQIVVEQYPKLGQTVTVGTQPYDFKSFLGFRNFLMRDETGDLLAYANSIWSLLDTRTGHPVRPTAEIATGYGIGERLDMEYAPRRISLPEAMDAGEPVQIRAHHLDINHHVNNGQFVRIAIDSLPEAFMAVDKENQIQQVRQLRVEYKKQVLLGEVLTPYIAHTGDRVYVIALKDGQEDLCCIAELEMKYD